MIARRLTIQDTEEALKLAERFKGESDQSVISQFLKNKENYLFGAFDHDKPIAIAIGYKLPRVDLKGPMFYLHEIEVDEKYRRQGIARQIFTLIRNECLQNGFHESFLITNKSNSAAVKLYESFGGKSLYDDDIVFAFQDWNG